MPLKPHTWLTQNGVRFPVVSVEEAETYAAARVAEARAQERKRCAQICDHYGGVRRPAQDIARLIRALAEQDKP